VAGTDEWEALWPTRLFGPCDRNGIDSVVVKIVVAFCYAAYCSAGFVSGPVPPSSDTRTIGGVRRWLGVNSQLPKLRVYLRS
jgi:hypothetical protein